jgi:signal transduction histidine kinase
VVDTGVGDVSWQVTGTAGSAGRGQALQAVRDRVEAFGGTMWVGEPAGDRETVRATVPLVDASVLAVTDHPRQRSG